MREAEAREEEAVDLYRFTSVLCAGLDQEGRQRIIEMLWEMAIVDEVAHEFEANLVWRVAELLASRPGIACGCERWWRAASA